MRLDLVDRTEDLTAFTVPSAQRTQALTGKEGAVLAYLLAACGRTVSLDELLQKMRGHVVSFQTGSFCQENDGQG